MYWKQNGAVPFMKLVTEREKEDGAKYDKYDKWCF